MKEAKALAGTPVSHSRQSSTISSAHGPIEITTFEERHWFSTQVVPVQTGETERALRTLVSSTSVRTSFMRNGPYNQLSTACTRTSLRDKSDRGIHQR